MATSIHAFGDAGASNTEEARSRGGILSRAFHRFMAAREARGRAVAYYHLARLSDERLVDLGYESAQIRRIRSFADYPGSYWI